MPKISVVIDEKMCKGCKICVMSCPTKVLTMKNLKAHVQYIDKCIGCTTCELRCPDFAIKVIQN